MKIKNKTGAYSIVEMIIYLAIFTVISILVINSYINIFSSFNSSRINRVLLNSGSTAIERISREIRQASSVDLANSTIGTSPGVLQLNSTNSAGSSMIIKFLVSSSTLKLYKDGSLVGDLTGQNVNVSSLIFKLISTSNSQAVKVDLILQKGDKSESFHDTIILRGSY